MDRYGIPSPLSGICLTVCGPLFTLHTVFIYLPEQCFQSFPHYIQIGRHIWFFNLTALHRLSGIASWIPTVATAISKVLHPLSAHFSCKSSLTVAWNVCRAAFSWPTGSSHSSTSQFFGPNAVIGLLIEPSPQGLQPGQVCHVFPSRAVRPNTFEYHQ